MQEKNPPKKTVQQQQSKQAPFTTRLIQGQRIAQEIKVPSAPQERVHKKESCALEK